VVAEALQGLDEISRCAWQDYYALMEGDRDRGIFLGILQKLEKDKINLFEKLGHFKQEDGIDPLVAAAILRESIVPAEFLNSLPDSFKKDLENAIVDNMLTAKLSEPELSEVALRRKKTVRKIE